LFSPPLLIELGLLRFAPKKHVNKDKIQKLEKSQKLRSFEPPEEDEHKQHHALDGHQRDEQSGRKA
jgi:hypothetical protein